MMRSSFEINLGLEERLTSSVVSTGNQTKWRKDGLWFKADCVGRESIAEWVATNVLKCSDIKVEFTEYGLCQVQQSDVHFDISRYSGCYSRDFLHPGDNLVTFARLFSENLTDWSKLEGNYPVDDKVQYCLEEVYRITRLDVTEYLAAVLTLDALIYNIDRHYSNLAIIFNEVTGFRPAPIFDNGLSCLSHYGNRNIDVARKLGDLKARPFCHDFKVQLEVLGAGFHVNKSKLLEFLKTNQEQLGMMSEIMEFSMFEYPAVYI